MCLFVMFDYRYIELIPHSINYIYAILIQRL